MPGMNGAYAVSPSPTSPIPLDRPGRRGMRKARAAAARAPGHRPVYSRGDEPAVLHPTAPPELPLHPVPVSRLSRPRVFICKREHQTPSKKNYALLLFNTEIDVVLHVSWVKRN